MTNDSPYGEAPNEIIADMLAGYPDHILKRNAAVPYQPGFLQDPGRVEFTALEFLWQNCYECALRSSSPCPRLSAPRTGLYSPSLRLIPCAVNLSVQL
jgi:hypothetical protein